MTIGPRSVRDRSYLENVLAARVHVSVGVWTLQVFTWFKYSGILTICAANSCAFVVVVKVSSAAQ